MVFQLLAGLHEVVKLNKDDAIAFYDTYYTPNNAVLIVAGDVSPNEVFALAKKTYGKIARRAEPASFGSTTRAASNCRAFCETH